MRKIISLIICFILIATCLSAVSCSGRVKSPIDYGEKYILREGAYYVFDSDKTGYPECNYSDYSGKVVSGKVYFEWREAS